jgi:xanthine dehydrogenase/oxidase
VLFALRGAIKAARDMNGKGVEGWVLDSPATAERLRLAVGDDIVERARTKREEGETNFLVAVA